MQTIIAPMEWLSEYWPLVLILVCVAEILFLSLKHRIENLKKKNEGIRDELDRLTTRIQELERKVGN